VKPIESGKPDGLDNLYTLLKLICLRRTNKILDFPSPEEINYELELLSEEKEMYYNISESSKKTVDDIISGRQAIEGYSGIFQTIIRLRLLCNHSTFDSIYRSSGMTA
jgi:SWI/SNF-related matrix-associated actin-dependent regulator of chromatin subfamily A3